MENSFRAGNHNFNRWDWSLRETEDWPARQTVDHLKHLKGFGHLYLSTGSQAVPFGGVAWRFIRSAHLHSHLPLQLSEIVHKMFLGRLNWIFCEVEQWG